MAFIIEWLIMTAYVFSNGQSGGGLLISTGDTLSVTAGGRVDDDMIAQGGSATISGSGAIAVGDTLSSAIGAGGVDLRSAATETVLSGGQVTGTQVEDGGYLTLSSGGTALSIDVFSGGSVNAVGATILGAVVNSGGGLGALGGNVSGVTVEAGGDFSIVSGFAVDTVLSGGSASVLGNPYRPSSYMTQTLVLSGGTLDVDFGGVARGVTISSGGSAIVMSGGTMSGAVIAGGTLEMGQYVYSRYTFNNPPQVSGLDFSGRDGTLLIDAPQEQPYGAISGFTATDRIIFAALPADPDGRYSVSGNSLTLSFGHVSNVTGYTETLNIIGASVLPFIVGTDPATGGEVVGVACYCTGTAILTPAGDVPVETIAPGDLVLTADGRAELVVWVGRRSYAGRFLAGQPHLLPVRFKAGSLGDGLPRRDLLVSPCHAMLLDGVLVQAGALTNGSSIVQERTAERVDYVHIELARHDVILAEGAPSETYLDDGNRTIFANVADYVGSSAPGNYYAPRVTDGYQVEAIRRRLLPSVTEAA